MKHDMIVDGEALRTVEGQQGYAAPLPSQAALRHMSRAVNMFGNQRRLAKAAGLPQPSVNRMMAGERSIYAEAAVAIENATHGLVARHHLRPDLWPEPEFGGVDATYLVGAALLPDGPDRIAAEEALIRAYLDARHRLNAARAALVETLEIDRV